MILDNDIDEIAKYVKEYNFSGAKVVVTGSTGLLGSLIAKGMLRANEKYNQHIKVYILARNEEKAKKIFKNYIGDKNLILLKNEIIQPVDIDEDIDYVFHTACVTASKDMINYPVEIIKTSVLGTMNMMDFAREHHAKSAVYFSSMEVFGVNDIKNRRLKENDLGMLDLTAVRSSYSESKRLCENLCKCYADEYDLNVCVARLTQTFGAGVPLQENKVFAHIAKSIVNDEDIILKSKGTLVRDYVYTTDAINAILLIAKYGIKGEVYNIANENTTISVRDMAQKVLDTFNPKRSLKFDFTDSKSMGFSPDSVTKLDTSKLRNLGWEPKHDLTEMYSNLLEYFRDIMKENSNEV